MLKKNWMNNVFLDALFKLLGHGCRYLLSKKVGGERERERGGPTIEYWSY